MTMGLPSLTTAAAELVVPRSMPIIGPLFCPAILGACIGCCALTGSGLTSADITGGGARSGSGREGATAATGGEEMGGAMAGVGVGSGFSAGGGGLIPVKEVMAGR